jgi:hypothetical protein
MLKLSPTPIVIASTAVVVFIIILTLPAPEKVV